MSDRKWVHVEHQDKLQDGTWLAYCKELEDTRDIMSDCVRPSWGRTGRYEVEVMKSDANNTTDYSIKITTDKKAGNWLSVTIRRHFYSYQALEDWLVTFCKALGTYRTGNGPIYGEITEELYKKYREAGAA